MRLYIDVETVPGQQPGERDRILAALKPPGTLKKADSIAAWWQDEAPAAAEAEWRKQALDPSAGELVAIGCATDDGKPLVFIRGPGDSEYGLICEFYSHMARLIEADAVTDGAGRTVFAAEPFLIAHAAQFDLGWLRGRSWVHNIRPPFKLPGADARAGKDYGCTMQLWAGWKDRISLDRLCRALGVPSPKAECDGSQVLDKWRAGDLASIRTYCAGDVHAVRECWQAMHWEREA